MKAGISSADGLFIANVHPPEPGRNDLLVRVHAAGLNRADLLASRGGGGARAGSLSKPVGMEWSGEIIAMGANVSGFAIGEMVACSGTGGYAEIAVADRRRSWRIDPSKISLEQAAALPMALMTAYNALRMIGDLTPGATVLVRGASSGVGIAACRIASLLGAQMVIATSTDPEKRERLAAGIADLSFDVEKAGFDGVLAATKGRGADVVVDLVGGNQLNDLIGATAIGGRIVNVGRLAGTTAQIDLDLHALRRVVLSGATFRTRDIDEVAAIVEGVASELWEHVLAGELNLPIDSTFRLKDAARAQARMAANAHFGKILLLP